MTRQIRIAAVADIHLAKTSDGFFQSLLSRVAESADVLLLCGDLTHHGLVEEAEILARELSRMRIPVLAVLGNHDFHSDQQEQIHRILEDAGIRMLDGDVAEVHGIGFAGVKGFATGFGQRVLEPWGEAIIKQFVHEAVNEALKLESALARLSAPQRIAILHYAPIRETVEGEPLEIFPFLGSSRLEEPLNRFKVTAAFHGHAHHGRLEGRTSLGVPVYNVSLPLLRASLPDSPPFRLIEIPVADNSTSA
jgi:Icc-related predicted phosphoesterase